MQETGGGDLSIMRMLAGLTPKYTSEGAFSNFILFRKCYSFRRDLYLTDETIEVFPDSPHDPGDSGLLRLGKEISHC